MITLKFNFNFVKYFIIAAVFSVLMVVVGALAGFRMWQGEGVGIDFRGGNAITVKFKKDLSIGEIRSLSDKIVKGLEIAHFPAEKKVIFKTRLVDIGGKKISNVMDDVFVKELGRENFVIEGITEIGPKVGKELKKDALIAVIMSIIGIIGYLAWRFEFKFGVAAAIATYHDVIGIVGIMHFLGYEMDLLILTALLTIAGYSLTDTVVVFDRIRENLRKRAGQGLSLREMLNISINEVFTRTVITSLTTFLSAIALLIFGGEVLRPFSLAVALGVVLGTYSSIFIASPLLMILKLDPKKMKQG